MTTEDLKVFLKEKIDDLTERRKEAEIEEDWLTHDYLEGCIDAYDIVLMKLTNQS